MKKIIRPGIRVLVVLAFLVVVGACSGYDGTSNVSVSYGYGYGTGYGYGPGWGGGWSTGAYYPGRPMGPYW